MKIRSTTLALIPAVAIALGGAVPQPPRATLLPPVAVPVGTEVPVFLQAPSPWADSVFATLSLDERIAQLMMVAAYSNKNAAHEAEIEKLVKERNIGGLIFFQGGPGRQVKLTNRFQAAAKTPLLLGMDLEWGLSMRLDSTIRFPRQMALGAIQDEGLVEEMGLEIARQMKRIGVHVSFSPVLDVNNNAANPVINDRSFGEDRENVTRKSLAYMRGLQNGGVLATAKHFPGHGDVDSDSHYTLPHIAHGRPRLDSLELYPFRMMAHSGLAAVMVAHLEVPALDSTKGLPSTLSAPIVTGILKEQLGFQGLIFTDALNMKGVANAAQPGEVELRALKAGNDVMLFPIDPVKAIERIKKAVLAGEVDSALVDRSCLKILRAKEWAGLSHQRTIPSKGLNADLNTAQGEALRRTLYGAAITVAKDHRSLLPVNGLDTLRIASVVIGDKLDNTFQLALKRQAEVSTFRCEKTISKDSLNALLRRLEPFNRVIVSVHGTSYRSSKQYGVPVEAMETVREIAARKSTIFALFANPYVLARSYGAHLLASTLVAYEETADSQEMMAEVIFGASAANGRLPVGPSAFFKVGDGLVMQSLGRTGYALPEQMDMNTADLKAMDSIVNSGITAQAYPGCQVLVAVDGQVVVHRTYGSPTYEKTRSVSSEDLYDLASITKVASTTIALMHLVDEGKLDVDKRLGTYLPELEGTYPGHARMQLREILSHQAGLKAFVPFQNRILDKAAYRPNTVSHTSSVEYPIRVAEGMYLNKAYSDSLFTWVLQTPLGTRGQYLYSDMGYYLLQAVIERLSGTELDRYVARTFYRPMGAWTMGYRPLERFPAERIAPTEMDVLFRKRQIQGDVHDPGAAMKGGVAGHAGLFSNANDLAKVMQMLVDGGTYGGTRYLSEAVVAEFTKCQFCKPDGSGNRRALGFDRPSIGSRGPTCECVSYASFGHTGFTGTMAWADPETRVVYIFLSNRVYPNAARNKLVELGIRTKVQEVISRAVANRGSAEQAAQRVAE